MLSLSYTIFFQLLFYFHNSFSFLLILPVWLVCFLGAYCFICKYFRNFQVSPVLIQFCCESRHFMISFIKNFWKNVRIFVFLFCFRLLNDLFCNFSCLFFRRMCILWLDGVISYGQLILLRPTCVLSGYLLSGSLFFWWTGMGGCIQLFLLGTVWAFIPCVL